MNFFNGLLRFSVDIWVAGFIFYTVRRNIDREDNAVNFLP